MKNSPLLNSSVEDNIGLLIGSCNRIKDRLLDQYLQDEGITGTQAKVLFSIYRCKLSRQCDIGKKLNVDGSAVTRMLDRMEKKGLITRTQSEHDRREIRVELTESGLDVTLRAVRLAYMAIEELCQPLSDDETEILRNILKKVIAFHCIG